MSTQPQKFENVTVTCKANVYFDGKVVSHSIVFADGSKKSLGLVYPGTFKFNTQAAEIMAITAGTCRVRGPEAAEWVTYAAGSAFNVAANSWFEIEVTSGVTEYICSFK